MRAQFGALTACALLLVACASDGAQQSIVHPKARKAVTAAPPIAPAITRAPTPLAAVTPQQPAVPSPPLASAPPLVSPQAALGQVTPIVPAIPAPTPPPPEARPSEIPTRTQRREKPDWTTPPRTSPILVPAPTPARAIPMPAPIAAPLPVVAAPPPPSPPQQQTTVPTPQQPPVATTPSSPAIAPQPTRPRPQISANAALTIDRPAGPAEARLPCNRSGSPHCSLRIYQVNVGTFVDGSPDHNPKGGYGPGPHTGDIEGVIGALDHIKALGFNAIWLTPIFDSRAGEPQARVSGTSQVNEKLDGTGYFPRDYFKIDPQFGTLEQTEALVSQAHALGIKVMFDGVFGHHKGGVVPSPSGGLPVDATAAAAYNGTPQNYPGRIVDFTNPRSTAFYKEVARFWIDTIGIDGWRLDQVYQVPSASLRDITTEITNAANAQLLSGYVVGEMWGTAAQIRDVLGPTNNPALASAFDFPTRYALVQTLASDENGGTKKPASTINEAWALGAHATYPDHAIMNFMLGNHDLVRFGDLIERAGKGGPTNPDYWAIHKLAFTFMAAWSGPITLYYGEEIGAEVAGFVAKVPGNCAAVNQCDDHVGRNMIAIPGVNAPVSASSAAARNLKIYLTSLMSLRAANPALSAGSRTHIFSDNDIYIDLKSDGTNRHLLVMNVSAAPRQIILKASGVGMAELTAATVGAGEINSIVSAAGLTLTVPALGAAILKLEGR
jgi:cyclomaltodextrinase / maltogenic alpha-amylase / neopullulanase